jgi:hypothetical protein
MHVVRVFAAAGEPGSGGLAGVVLDGRAVPPAGRQAIAARRGLPEIVFVDDRSRGVVRVHTPSRERPYAGYPLLGAAWILHQHGWPVEALACAAGSVPVHCTEDAAFMTLPNGWRPPAVLQQVRDSATLRAMPPRSDRVILWSWDGAHERRVVARCTIPDHPAGEGISASVAAGVAAALGTPLEVELGRRSRALVPFGDDAAHVVGGCVRLERIEPVAATA